MYFLITHDRHLLSTLRWIAVCHSSILSNQSLKFHLITTFLAFHSMRHIFLMNFSFDIFNSIHYHQDVVAQICPTKNMYITFLSAYESVFLFYFIWSLLFFSNIAFRMDSNSVYFQLIISTTKNMFQTKQLAIFSGCLQIFGFFSPTLLFLYNSLVLSYDNF